MSPYCRFVRAILGDPTGYFVDFGAHRPQHGNNTFDLEALGWEGLSFELDPVAHWPAKRNTKCIGGDATAMNLPEMFLAHDVPTLIDYISIDVDDSTLDLISNLPFAWDYRVATVEHNAYAGGPRDEIRELVAGHGMEIIAADVLTSDGRPFEDWWVHPGLVDMNRAEQLRCHGKPWNEMA